MKTKCLNCDQPLAGKYCNNCGQPSDTHRISFHFLIHDIQHGLLHVDKGIFYTIKELCLRPGHAIREFLKGKRVKHFKPLSFVIILAGLYGFLSHYFHINVLTNNLNVEGNNDPNFQKVSTMIENSSQWLIEHYVVLTFVQIPVFSLASYLFFKKSAYNYVEHLVINTYLSGLRLFIHLLFFPLYYIYNGSATLSPIAKAVDFLCFAFVFIAFIQLFNNYTKKQRIWRSLLTLLLSFFILLIFFAFAFKFFILNKLE